MNHRSHPSLALALVALVLAAAPAAPIQAGRQAAAAPAAVQPPARYFLHVFVAGPDDVRRLTAGPWDVLETRGPDYLVVLGDEATARELRARGFTVAVEAAAETLDTRAPFTFYGGYHTVAEHYQHLDAVAAAHPDLAAVIQYGDSWRQANGVPDGHDLKAICITRRQAGDCALAPATGKARFLLIAATHARELSTSEMAWRWIDYLVAGDGVDPDITALLDSSEMWVAPVVNPDGRYIVETADMYQRKNADTNWCPSYSFGVDLNRNGSFRWGGIGASTDPCDETFRGPSPASEPEESALENLMRHLFPVQRSPVLTEPVAITATGVMLTLHSYGNLALLPWGDSDCGGATCPPGLRTPNDAQLRSLAFRMSYFNGYLTGQGAEALYATSGSSDDWAYGTLGIPAFTFEIGPDYGGCSGFLPQYACQDNTFWPLNRNAFLYAARVARQPYMNAVGPTALTPIVTPTGVITQGLPLTLTAVIDDGRYGASGFVRPSPQAVARAEYYVDIPPWAGGTAAPMAALDGAFNGTVETARGVVGPCDLPAGRHTLFVRGQDAGGNWGPVTAKWITVTRVADVSIAGPRRGLVAETHAFTATVTPNPPCTVPPIRYDWQATNQAPMTHTSGLTDVAVFTWADLGWQTITVTAASISNTLMATVTLFLLQPSAFMPLALR